MTRNNNRRSGGLSIQSIAIIILCVISVALFVTTIITANGNKSAQTERERTEDVIHTRFVDELYAVNMLLSRQSGESGDARINTLTTMQRHLYAAEAISSAKVAAMGGDGYISVDQYTLMSDYVDQAIRQINSGLSPDGALNELSTQLAAYIG